MTIHQTGASHDKDRRGTSWMSSEQRQWLVDKLEIDIDFAKRFGQQLTEEDRCQLRCQLKVHFYTVSIRCLR